MDVCFIHSTIPLSPPMKGFLISNMFLIISTFHYSQEEYTIPFGVILVYTFCITINIVNIATCFLSLPAKKYRLPSFVLLRLIGSQCQCWLIMRYLLSGDLLPKIVCFPSKLRVERNKKREIVKSSPARSIMFHEKIGEAIIRSWNMHLVSS